MNLTNETVVPFGVTLAQTRTPNLSADGGKATTTENLTLTGVDSRGNPKFDPAPDSDVEAD